MKLSTSIPIFTLIFCGASACSHSPSLAPKEKLKITNKAKLASPPLPSTKFSPSLVGKRKITYPLMTKLAEINLWESSSALHGPTPNAFPIIEVKTTSKREIILLKDFPNFSVTHVFQDLPGGKILILLDYAVEGPLEEYARILSVDEGLSWKRISPLPKNPATFPFGELVSLWGNNKGEWTAHFSQDNKIFRSISVDEGENWQPESAPIYENEWSPLSPNS